MIHVALRNIVKKGDPILTKKSRVVDQFDQRLFTLLDDMKETLREADGVGIAAVQVGVLKRVVLVDIGDGLLELINPTITKSQGEQRASEGCLSFPGEYGTTLRPAKVQVNAQDRTGKWHIYTGEDLKARAFCHEIDHLDGISFLSHLVDGEETK